MAFESGVVVKLDSMLGTEYLPTYGGALVGALWSGDGVNKLKKNSTRLASSGLQGGTQVEGRSCGLYLEDKHHGCGYRQRENIPSSNFRFQWLFLIYRETSTKAENFGVGLSKSNCVGTKVVFVAVSKASPYPGELRQTSVATSQYS